MSAAKQQQGHIPFSFLNGVSLQNGVKMDHQEQNKTNEARRHCEKWPNTTTEVSRDKPAAMVKSNIQKLHFKVLETQHLYMTVQSTSKKQSFSFYSSFLFQFKKSKIHNSIKCFSVEHSIVKSVLCFALLTRRLQRM